MTKDSDVPPVKRTRKSKKGERARDAILDAATELMKTTPASSISIDAVAAKAEITKSGLLHHFSSKEELFRALVRRVIQINEADQVVYGTNVIDEQPNEVDFIINHINRSFLKSGTAAETTKTLLAIAAYDPSLLDPVYDFFEQQSARIMQNSANPYAMLILITFAGGVYMYDAMGASLFMGELRDEVHKAALALARELMERQDGRPSLTNDFAGNPPVPSDADKKRRRARTTRARGDDSGN